MMATLEIRRPAALANPVPTLDTVGMF